MNIGTSLGCKQAARDVLNYDSRRWISNAKEICKSGIEAKFMQNPALMNLLRSTGKKKLAEASYDNVFGTGVPLNSEDCLNESKWEGVGILGEILMDIRKDAGNIIGCNRPEAAVTDTSGVNVTTNG